MARFTRFYRPDAVHPAGYEWGETPVAWVRRTPQGFRPMVAEEIGGPAVGRRAYADLADAIGAMDAIFAAHHGDDWDAVS